MTKQKEIREGMLNIFGRAGVIKSGGVTCISSACMDEIMMFLHKSGVVIKVEKEPPELFLCKDEHCQPYCHQEERNGILKAGYTTTEPLIVK